MWLLFSLLAAAAFALVLVLDDHCVGEIFEKPWIGVITSSIASIAIYQTIPFVEPFVSLNLPSVNIVILAFSAGILIQISQAFYFQALSYGEAGIVSAYWNITPALLPIVSYIVFGTLFSLAQYLGMVMIILSSIYLCILDGNVTTRWKAIFLMLFAALIQLLVFIIEDMIFDQSSFFIAYLIIITGVISAGFIALILPEVRKVIRRNSRRLITLLRFFVIIEIVNLVALLFSQRAISYGNATLVATAESTVPAFAFMISYFFVNFTKLYKDPHVNRNLIKKISGVIFMCVGVWFIYK